MSKSQNLADFLGDVLSAVVQHVGDVVDQHGERLAGAGLLRTSSPVSARRAWSLWEAQDGRLSFRLPIGSKSDPGSASKIDPCL
jgi:hypothetical protein